MLGTILAEGAQHHPESGYIRSILKSPVRLSVCAGVPVTLPGLGWKPCFWGCGFMIFADIVCLCWVTGGSTVSVMLVRRNDDMLRTGRYEVLGERGNDHAGSETLSRSLRSRQCPTKLLFR